jgi:hypothetical protein
MKLTEENADYMDCRPLLEGEVDLRLVPEHIRALLLQQRVEEAALSAPILDNDKPPAEP